MVQESKSDQIKSIELCSKMIERMASNSFKLKSWFLVSFSALFTFIAKCEKPVPQDLVWVVPFFFFAGLDAYYLRLERIFRLVYEDFQKTINSGTEYRKPYDMEPNKEQWKEFTVMHCLFSPSVEWFYFPLIASYWIFVALLTLNGHWSKWIVVFFLPVLSALGMAFCRKCYQSKSKVHHA
ncbi:MAG: hypothetical protein IT215_08495 [Chitinophagaceae bacterium]|jgi:hypothetical protein|nr:hypothetical protein [Chitinophagaceae bacterium]